MIQSDLLILLSDVDGLYTGDPAREGSAQARPPSSSIIDATVERWAGGASGTGIGSGGMRTKIAAARIAQSFGCATIIASGHGERPLSQLLTKDARATVVDASDLRLERTSNGLREPSSPREAYGSMPGPRRRWRREKACCRLGQQRSKEPLSAACACGSLEPTARKSLAGSPVILRPKCRRSLAARAGRSKHDWVFRGPTN